MTSFLTSPAGMPVNLLKTLKEGLFSQAGLARVLSGAMNTIRHILLFSYIHQTDLFRRRMDRRSPCYGTESSANCPFHDIIKWIVRDTKESKDYIYLRFIFLQFSNCIPFSL